jgi:site-specific recombinase XerD
MTNSEGESSRQDYELVGELVRIFLRGDVWWANFQHEGKQQRQSLGTRSKKEARRKALKLEAELLDGRFQRPMTVPGIAEGVKTYMEYLRTEGRAAKTLVKYQTTLDRLVELAAHRHITKLSGVDLNLIDAYRTERSEKNSAKTVHTETVILKQLVNFAVTRGMLASNSLKGLKLKRPKLRPQPCWSRKEMDRIVAAAKEPQRSMLTLLAETGMRIGELKHLTWDDLDFARGVILIREKEGWKPKTGDERAIPMSPMARVILSRLLRTATWVFTSPPSRHYPKGGQPLSERRLLEYPKRVIKRLGLQGHLHTFRHSFISHALTQGTPEAIVRQWVGHVDPEILKHYTHVLDQTSQAAMRRLAEGNPQTPQQGKEASNGTTDADSR